MEQNGLFAHVNDSIRTLASEHSAAKIWEFVCECPDVACNAPVSLTLNEFDERRAALPPVPVLAPDHDA